MALIVSYLTVLIFTITFGFVADANKKHSDDHQYQLPPVDLSLYPSKDNIGIEGEYLRVLLGNLPPFLNVTRNSTGHVTELKGVFLPVLDWLSRASKFKYIILPDNVPGVEDTPAGKGLMSFVVEGIWLFLFISILAAITFLYGIIYGVSRIFAMTKDGFQALPEKRFEEVIRASEYVLGTLFSQGLTAHKDSNNNRKLAIRLLTGSWCIACFILITAYSSVLISFVTSPYYKPLIDSIHDFPKNTEVKILVDKGLYPDILFTNAERGVFKYLGDQLRTNPQLRCSGVENCLNLVRTGSGVYTQVQETLENILGIDLRKTGRCDFTLAKEFYSYFSIVLPIAKQMEVEFFNRGMMRAHEGGFVNLWTKRYAADPSRCLNKLGKHDEKNIRLTLGGLSGAFVVLVFGISLSILVWISEIIFKRFKK